MFFVLVDEKRVVGFDYDDFIVGVEFVFCFFIVVDFIVGKNC